MNYLSESKNGTQRLALIENIESLRADVKNVEAGNSSWHYSHVTNGHVVHSMLKSDLAKLLAEFHSL